PDYILEDHILIITKLSEVVFTSNGVIGNLVLFYVIETLNYNISWTHSFAIMYENVKAVTYYSFEQILHN
ncbi:hypothetical protein ACJX0J_024576, partial [Zea mays]